MGVRGPKWSEDECRVLTAIFFNARFSIGDDAHPECHAIADCFGRTPGSVDRQWRNIATIVNETGPSHIGQLVRDSVRDFLNDPATFIVLAKTTIARRGWELDSLVEVGSIKNAFSEINDSHESVEILEMFRSQLSNLDYKIFPSGSHGYCLEHKTEILDCRFQINISCVMAGSLRSELVHMKTTRDDLIKELTNQLCKIRIRKSQYGRFSIHQRLNLVCHGERFTVVFRLLHLVG